MSLLNGLNHRDPGYFSEVVHLIYDACMRPERWNAVVATIASSLGCNKGLLFTPYLAPQHGGFVFPAGISEATLQLWGSSYIEHDIWAHDLQRKKLWKTGEVIVDEDMTPAHELLASRFYTEFLSKLGIGRVCAGMVFGWEPGFAFTTLPFFRAYDEPPFTEKDRAWLKLITAHVSRSLGVMYRLNKLQLQNTSLMGAFDRLAFGVVLLDDNLRVQHVNHAAQRVLQRDDGLCINVDGQLDSTLTQRRSPHLARWLVGMQDMEKTAQSHFLQGCRVSRKDGGHYVIQCSPLPDNTDLQLGGNTSRHVIFLTDPAEQTLPPIEKLTTLYALTPTQAKVAVAFARGDTYKQVALRLRISEETVRSHVKAIYPKAGVNRQVDLVRLILSLGEGGV